jgi:hypothetical protein
MRVLLAGVLLLGGCSFDREVGGFSPRADAGPPAEEDGGTVVVRCEEGDDPDGDTISSLDEGPGDLDGDGRPSPFDDDSDGDGLPDALEAGDADCTTAPVDSDHDGFPDFLDLDSDGDTLSDRHETAADHDGDGIADYLDADSDNDGIADLIEAGDTRVDTPPVECPEEIDPVSGEPVSDARPDFVDPDSDNDGLSDLEEEEAGTMRCGVDSDLDGLSDLVEVAYQRVNCPDGVTGIDCNCARNASCRIPDRHFYVVLPYGAPAVAADLRFGTSIGAADIYFLTDTSSSMTGTLLNVKETVGRPRTGLIDRISETIPDAWFGGGQYEDFPFPPYGTGDDEPFELAIGMTPPTLEGLASGSGRELVARAFGAMTLGRGGDPTEAHTEALYQLFTGEGGRWDYGPASYTLTFAACGGGGHGGACFRRNALPVAVHFTDSCGHAGPPEDDPVACSRYEAIAPPPHGWADLVAAMRIRGARYIGVNTTQQPCADAVAPDGGPCYFMNRTAIATGSVDLDGRPLVYDVPDASSDALFVSTVAGAIETLATRVPVDVDTLLRDEGADGVDATRFLRERAPACRASPPAATCFVPPSGVPPHEAVAGIDESTFFGVVPGTQVEFRLTFENSFLPGGATARVFVAFIDVRADGIALLETRQVFVVVPASSTHVVF